MNCNDFFPQILIYNEFMVENLSMVRYNCIYNFRLWESVGSMVKENRIIVFSLIFIIIVVSALSIFLYNKEHRVEEIKKETKELVKESANLDDFKKKLSESDIEISEETENTECELIGASEGVTYLIENQEIQVYRFDFNKSEEITITNLKMAQDESKIILPSFNNIEIQVTYNKGLILINNEDHKKWNEILEIFKSL